MKILPDLPPYEVTEANFESLRIALNYLGEHYTPEYFHGIAGTAFRIGGICPCAPTCTAAMSPQYLIALLGYTYETIGYDDADKDGSLARLTDAVRTSIDDGRPVIVWNAFTECEFDVVAGYDEQSATFYGRGSVNGGRGEYAKKPWDRSLNQAGLIGGTAIVIKKSGGGLDKKAAEIAALNEAIRHACDTENSDKQDGTDWVFLQGKAAYARWARDFSDANHAKGIGDSYCADIYTSTHAQAAPFLQGLAAGYPGAAKSLKAAAKCFAREAKYLAEVRPLLGWRAPERDGKRNAKAAALLKKAADSYSAGIDTLAAAATEMI